MGVPVSRDGVKHNESNTDNGFGPARGPLLHGVLPRARLFLVGCAVRSVQPSVEPTFGSTAPWHVTSGLEKGGEKSVPRGDKHSLVAFHMLTV